MHQPISPEALKKRIVSGEALKIIDIRTETEQQEFPIENARSLDVSLLPKTYTGIFPENWLQGEVIIVCGNGLQSEILARLLRKRGFMNLRNLEGGTEALLGQ